MYEDFTIERAGSSCIAHGEPFTIALRTIQQERTYVYMFEVEPFRHCCGASLVTGLRSGGYASRTEGGRDHVSKTLKRIHEYLTDLEYWKEIADDWDAEGEDEWHLAILLTKSKLVAIDAVGGEYGEGSLCWYTMAKSHGWGIVGEPTHNPGSGNEVVLLEWNNDLD